MRCRKTFTSGAVELCNCEILPNIPAVAGHRQPPVAQEHTPESTTPSSAPQNDRFVSPTAWIVAAAASNASSRAIARLPLENF